MGGREGGRRREGGREGRREREGGMEEEGNTSWLSTGMHQSQSTL